MSKVRIVNKGWTISIESDNSRYETLERLMMFIGIYLIEKGKIESLKSILDVLQIRLEMDE